MAIKFKSETQKSTAARKDVQRQGKAERSQVTVPVVVSSEYQASPVDAINELEEFRRLKEKRREFMRLYMADQRKASKLGMTVREYRKGKADEHD